MYGKLIDGIILEHAPQSLSEAELQEQGYKPVIKDRPTVEEGQAAIPTSFTEDENSIRLGWEIYTEPATVNKPSDMEDGYHAAQILLGLEGE